MPAPQQAMLATGRRFAVALPTAVTYDHTAISATGMSITFQNTGNVDSLPQASATITVPNTDAWPIPSAGATADGKWAKPFTGTPGDFFECLVHLTSGTLDTENGAASPANRDTWVLMSSANVFTAGIAVPNVDGSTKTAVVNVQIRDATTQEELADCAFTLFILNTP